MELPTKIDPDRITGAFIEIKFLSIIPYEIYLGLFYKSLDDSYTYVNRPGFTHVANSNENIALLPATAIFFNDLIKFEVRPNAIIFSCKDKYIGWDKYYPQIKEVLRQIYSSGAISAFTSVGIRYISEYPEIDIRQIADFAFPILGREINTRNYTFSTEFSEDNYRVIINLSTLPFVTENNNQSLLSAIDVDVIEIITPNNSLDQLYEVIQDLHTVEKKVFFRILSQNFLQSLNPTY